MTSSLSLLAALPLEFMLRIQAGPPISLLLGNPFLTLVEDILAPSAAIHKVFGKFLIGPVRISIPAHCFLILNMVQHSSLPYCLNISPLSCRESQ